MKYMLRWEMLKRESLVDPLAPGSSLVEADKGGRSGVTPDEI